MYDNTYFKTIHLAVLEVPWPGTTSVEYELFFYEIKVWPIFQRLHNCCTEYCIIMTVLWWGLPAVGINVTSWKVSKGQYYSFEVILRITFLGAIEATGTAFVNFFVSGVISLVDDILIVVGTLKARFPLNRSTSLISVIWKCHIWQGVNVNIIMNSGEITNGLDLFSDSHNRGPSQ